MLLQYFTATSPFVEYYIIAREAIAARKLQFRINEYGRNDTFFCWGLVLLGCPIDNSEFTLYCKYGNACRLIGMQVLTV